MASIVVVGAGISGLLSAYYAARGSECSHVRVYEARSEVGRPHCTGLVSAETLNRMPFAREFVEGAYSSLKVIVPELRASVTIVFEDSGFVRLDRVGHERRLYHELTSLGVEVSRGDPVYTIEERGGRWVVRSRSGSRSYDLLVLASGYSPRLTRAAGLSCRVETLSGAQVEVETDGRAPEGEDSVVVILSRHFGSGFSWTVPTGERKLVVGCATRPGTLESLGCLRMVLSLLSKVRGGFRSVSEPRGGVILRGYPVKPFNDRAMGVGDCVSMVKSLSGGGLYAISIASRLVGAFVERRLEPLESLGLLSRRLRGHYLMVSAIENAIRVAEAAGLKGVRMDVWTRGVGYDNHLGILLGVLGDRGALFELAKRRRARLRIEARKGSVVGRLAF